MKQLTLLLIVLLIGCVVGVAHGSSRDLIDTWLLYGTDTVGEPLESGGATVAISPVSATSMRISTVGTTSTHGVAGTRYRTRIPNDTRSVRVEMLYNDTSGLDHSDEVAGRAWVKRERKGDDYASFYPDDPDKAYVPVDSGPLFGDIYVLPQGQSSQVIELSADDHVIGGYLELHIFVVDSQQIDIRQIKVEAYTSEYKSRVVTRYVQNYQWRSWRSYGYWSFYTGPTYWYDGYWYNRYYYPGHSYYSRRIYGHWNGYWSSYYDRHPYSHSAWRRYHHYTHNPTVVPEKYVHNVWTKSHTETRQRYVRAKASNNATAMQEVSDGLLKRRAARLSTSPNVQSRERPGVGGSRAITQERRAPGTVARDTETRSGTTWGPTRRRAEETPATWSISTRRSETPGATGTFTRARPGNERSRNRSRTNYTSTQSPSRSGSGSKGGGSSASYTSTPSRNRSGGGGGSRARTPQKAVSRAPQKKEEETGNKGSGRQRPGGNRTGSSSRSSRSRKSKK